MKAFKKLIESLYKIILGGISLRKVFYYLFVLVLISSVLAGCMSGGKMGGPSESTSSSGDKNTDAQGGKEISIALHDSPWKKAIESIVPLYEKETGNKVKLNVFPYNGLYEKYVTASTTKSDEFDVAFVDVGWTPLLNSVGYLTPIKEVDPKFSLDPEILEYNYFTRWDKEKQYPTKDGDVVTLPVNGNLQLLYYRKDILKDLGVEPPKTWDDVLNIAKKVHDPKKEMYGFVTGGQSGNRVSYDFLPFLYSHGGDILANPAEKDYTVIINNDAGKRAVDTWLELMTKYAPPGIADIGQSDVLSYLATGKAAMGLTVAAQFSFMDDPSYSVVKDKIDFVVPPAGEGGTPASTNGAFLMGIPQGSQNKQGALDFMKWLTSKEAQIEFTKSGGIPVRKDIYTSELADQPEFRYLKAMEEAAKYTYSRPAIKNYTELEDLLGRSLNKILIGEFTPEKALEEVTKFKATSK
ncbi:extracellular solute-binding protein [Neobacillus sp. 19]|uniref:extracellular solute-binding protein n=1 Tax=Neobacillus sp. 19 TaxID=3394458 RepID=UPI003BF664E5